MTQHRFTLLRTVLVPVISGCDCRAALATARALAPQVLLVGLVKNSPGEPLSAGARLARQVRKRLRELVDGSQVRSRACVHVSNTPWVDLLMVIAAEDPDLLLLEWDCYLEALGVTPAEVLTQPPCDVALVRGPFPPSPMRVLVPLRGGPHAELALRLGLSLHPRELTTLHLTPPEPDGTDAPFRGLEQVLKHMPKVQARAAVTTDPAQTILEATDQFDLVVLGATARSLDHRSSLGPVADRVLSQTKTAVIAVKTRRTMPPTTPDETMGMQAVSILVDKWFAENTFHAKEFADLEQLMTLKREQGVTISLALPALNEEETIGR